MCIENFSTFGYPGTMSLNSYTQQQYAFVLFAGSLNSIVEHFPQSLYKITMSYQEADDKPIPVLYV